mgnify:CR=1 FL=1
MAGAMAGYGAMFGFLIRWITRKNDDLIKIMLGNDHAWKEHTSECLDEIREPAAFQHLLVGGHFRRAFCLYTEPLRRWSFLEGFGCRGALWGNCEIDRKSVV